MKRFLAICLLLALSASAALADFSDIPHYETDSYPYHAVGPAQPAAAGVSYDAFWIIPDSDTRLLTEEELWRYTRETLRYIRNEILARAGYAFESLKFYNYFNSKPWYSAGGYETARRLSKTAWSNVTTVKRVERWMDQNGTENAGAIDISQIIEYQNRLGGYGNMLDYGNSRGVGGGLTLAENDPAYRSAPQSGAAPTQRRTPRPYYCYTTQYIIPDSDTRPLTEGELWAYSRETLRYIRNEILARHGYAFNKDKVFTYFSGKAWYAPGGYNDDLLSSLEWKNISLIKSVEHEMDDLGLDNRGYLDIETIIYNQNNGLCPGDNGVFW